MTEPVGEFTNLKLVQEIEAIMNRIEVSPDDVNFMITFDDSIEIAAFDINKPYPLSESDFVAGNNYNGKFSCDNLFICYPIKFNKFSFITNLVNSLKVKNITIDKSLIFIDTVSPKTAEWIREMPLFPTLPIGGVMSGEKMCWIIWDNYKTNRKSAINGEI